MMHFIYKILILVDQHNMIYNKDVFFIYSLSSTRPVDYTSQIYIMFIMAGPTEV